MAVAESPMVCNVKRQPILSSRSELKMGCWVVADLNKVKRDVAKFMGLDGMLKA